MYREFLAEHVTGWWYKRRTGTRSCSSMRTIGSISCKCSSSARACGLIAPQQRKPRRRRGSQGDLRLWNSLRRPAEIVALPKMATEVAADVGDFRGFDSFSDDARTKRTDDSQHRTHHLLAWLVGIDIL